MQPKHGLSSASNPFLQLMVLTLPRWWTLERPPSKCGTRLRWSRTTWLSFWFLDWIRKNIWKSDSAQRQEIFDKCPDQNWDDLWAVIVGLCWLCTIPKKGNLTCESGRQGRLKQQKKYKVDEFFDCISNAYMPFHLFCEEEIIKILYTHIYIIYVNP